jgi:hypothetical protein
MWIYKRDNNGLLFKNQELKILSVVAIDTHILSIDDICDIDIVLHFGVEIWNGKLSLKPLRGENGFSEKKLRENRYRYILNYVVKSKKIDSEGFDIEEFTEVRASNYDETSKPNGKFSNEYCLFPTVEEFFKNPHFFGIRTSEKLILFLSQIDPMSGSPLTNYSERVNNALRIPNDMEDRLKLCRNKLR